MPTPAFVNQSSTTTATQVTTTTCPLPGSRVVGNYLVAAITGFPNGTPAAGGTVVTPGWTQLYMSPAWGFGGRQKLGIWGKRIDGTEVDPITIGNDQAAAVYYDAVIAQYTNVVAAGSALDGAGASGAGSVALTAVAPAITVAVANSLVLAFGTGGDNTQYTVDYPGNTKRYEVGNAGVPCQITLAEIPMAAPGTLAAGTWTRVAGNQAWMGHAVALLAGPAPVTPPISPSASGLGQRLVTTVPGGRRTIAKISPALGFYGRMIKL